MSGPKEGYWDFDYDPTPTRLADLGRFATKLDAWLDRHGSFILHNLDNKALESARAARSLIDEYIKAEDPDKGFDSYGAAWDLFNRLYLKALDAKRKRKQQERYERLKREQAAARLLAECKAIWQDLENQTLLKRWANRIEFQNLAAALEAIGVGTLQQIQQKAQTWQQRFEHTLDAAAKRAEQNSRAVQEYGRQVQAEIQRLSKLNIKILTDDEQAIFTVERDKLQQAFEDALSNQVMGELRSVFHSLKNLEEQYTAKVKTARFKKATVLLQEALSRCGYSVTSRTEQNGTRVFQASGFPLKSLGVEINPDTNKMKLNASGKEHCVEDVQSLQAELAKNGLVLTMTDWGAGNPQSTHQCLRQNLRVEGVE